MEPLILTGIGELATNHPGPAEGVIREAALVIQDDTVAWTGPGGDLPAEWAGALSLDLEGRAVMPGFVDSHTHLVFAGDRSDEFARRMASESYADIAAAGGGILATVAATRAADREALVQGARRRMERMLATGTTTLEVKSGYGLDTATELLMLEVAAEAAAGLPISLRRTFLGAHTVPPDYRTDRAGYVDLVIDEMLPACAPHADYCDVFVEEGAFDLEEARRILVAGQALGLGARVHAEQLGHSGGAALAAELSAVSADHLDHVTAEDAAGMAEAGTVAGLVPGASFQLRHPQAPGPMLWEAGVTVALATDCNPGTSYIESMPFVVALAVTQMGLTVEQAAWAATRGGALSLGMDDRGRLAPGDRADLIILNAPSVAHLAYRPATALVAMVVVAGEIVVGGERRRT
jgi:imidazolonepropionase